ncbi:MAG TPA: TatD family hydrolase [Vicinamibacterales bacterium]|jgi:TatD DNase family protein
MIDSHCHLADEVFAPDLAEVVGRAREAGLAAACCILAAGDAGEAARARAVRAAWPAAKFAVGVHPHQAHEAAGAAGPLVCNQLTGDVPICAIGEIGLDYHYDFSPRAVQQEVFRSQVALAVGQNLPVIVHTREADEDTIAILREAGAGRVRGVIHCFTGGAELARQALDLGFLISLAGIVTFRSASALRDVARTVPDDRLLVETDSPFLAPVPHRGTRNEPAHVVRVAEALAELRETTIEAIEAHTTRNFHGLFGA